LNCKILEIESKNRKSKKYKFKYEDISEFPKEEINFDIQIEK